MKYALLQVEKVEEEYIPPRDPKNPLCPGSTRANGEVSHTVCTVAIGGYCMYYFGGINIGSCKSSIFVIRRFMLCVCVCLETPI